MEKGNKAVITKDDIWNIIRGLRKNWYVFALIIPLAYIIALIVLYQSTPIYQASCSILLKGQQDIKSEAFLGKSFSNAENFQNEKRIITSPNLIKEVISRTNFTVAYFISKDFKTEETDDNEFFKVTATIFNNTYYNIPFEIKLIDSTKYELSYKINKIKYSGTYGWGAVAGNSNFKFIVLKNKAILGPDDLKLPAYSFKVLPLQTVVDKYRMAINITNDKDNADVIEVSLKDEVENKAVKFLDTLNKVYIENDIKRSITINNNTLKFIEQQLDETVNILNNVETDLEHYKKEKVIYQVGPEYGRLSEELVENGTKKSKLEMQLRNLNDIQKYLIETKDLSTLLPLTIEGDQDAYLTSNLQQLYSLLDERKKSLYAMTESSTDAVSYQINVLKQKIIAYINEVKNTANNNIQQINKEILQVEEGLKKLPKTERELLNITRRVEIIQGIYAYLLKKKSEIIIEKGGLISQKAVIESPRSKGVISPVKEKVIGNYIIIALIISALIVLVRTLFYNTIDSTSGILNFTSVPLIGVVPKMKKSDFNYMIFNDTPKSIYAEAFRHIVANMEYIGPKNKKVILVTSFMGSEGKTLNSVNLACVLAEAGYKTILLDIDLYKPNIHTAMQMNNSKGIVNILKGTITVEEAITSSSINNLDVIFSGTGATTGLITNQKLDYLFDTLKTQYDYIVVDTPPIIVSDVKRLMKYSDVNICVLKAEKSRSTFLEHIDFHINKAYSANMGFVFNENKHKNDDYNYGYIGRKEKLNMN